MTKDQCLLIVFVKNPIEGKVKTRLAKDIGPANALKVYQQLLTHTASICKEINQAQKAILYSDFVEKNDQFSDQYLKKIQQGCHLGEKMSNAFESAFESGYQKVILIGSDCADLNAKIITEGFNALDNHDVVVGPAKDGGYYLIGSNHYFPALFKDKTYSHDKVYSELTKTIINHELNYRPLAILSDIDNIHDFNQSQLKI